MGNMAVQITQEESSKEGKALQTFIVNDVDKRLKKNKQFKHIFSIYKQKLEKN